MREKKEGNHLQVSLIGSSCYFEETESLKALCIT